jgi:hypothetical protein
VAEGHVLQCWRLRMKVTNTIFKKS